MLSCSARLSFTDCDTVKSKEKRFAAPQKTAVFRRRIVLAHLDGYSCFVIAMGCVGYNWDCANIDVGYQRPGVLLDCYAGGPPAFPSGKEAKKFSAVDPKAKGTCKRW